MCNDGLGTIEFLWRKEENMIWPHDPFRGVFSSYLTSNIESAVLPVIWKVHITFYMIALCLPQLLFIVHVCGCDDVYILWNSWG